MGKFSLRYGGVTKEHAAKSSVVTHKFYQTRTAAGEVCAGILDPSAAAVVRSTRRGIEVHSECQAQCATVRSWCAAADLREGQWT